MLTVSTRFVLAGLTTGHHTNIIYNNYLQVYLPKRSWDPVSVFCALHTTEIMGTDTQSTTILMPHLPALLLSRVHQKIRRIENPE